MDSKGFQQTAGEGHISQTMNNNRLPPYPNNEVDLTLRLGLPQYDNQTRHEQNMGQIPMPPPDSNLNLRGSSAQVANQYGMVTGQVIAEGGWGNDTSQVSRSPDMATPCMNSNGLGDYNFIPYPDSTLPMNNYAIINGSQGMGEFEAGSSSVTRRKYAPRQRSDTGSLNIERRCSNPNCNTNDTPMWRKGPLGPKTLCNACGIKYRKDEERRRGNGVAEPSGHD